MNSPKFPRHPAGSVFAFSQTLPVTHAVLSVLALRVIATSKTSFSRVLLAGERFSESWNPDRDTSKALHSHATGQIEPCFATKANLMSLTSRSRLRPFLRCLFPLSTSRLLCASGQSLVARASFAQVLETHAWDQHRVPWPNVATC